MDFFLLCKSVLGCSVYSVTRSYQLVTKRLFHCHLLQEKPPDALGGCCDKEEHEGWVIAVVYSIAGVRRGKGTAQVTWIPACPQEEILLCRRVSCVGTVGTIFLHRGENTIPESMWRDKWASVRFSLCWHTPGKLSLLCNMCSPTGSAPSLFWEKDFPSWPISARDIINVYCVVRP